ncbi:MAG: peptidyl-prolyl cis-trans isomerase [Trichlorobacter sp.]|mgnify:FL=1
MTTTQILARITVLVLLAASLTACGKGDNQGSAKKGTVLATVNGATITTADLEQEVKTLPDYLRGMAETPQGRQEMIETLIMRELILQKASKDGIDKDKEVEDKLRELKKRVIVDTFLRKKVEADASLSDEELKKIYNQNLDKFKVGEQVRASHILVKSSQEAQAVLEALKKGEKFEELAKSKSLDASAAKGGDLGWFGKGNMVPVFEKAAFGLKEGQTSGIIKSQFGFHVIKLTGKRPAGTRPFEEVKDQIKSSIMPQKQQQVFMKLKEDLRKGAKIQINDAPAADKTAPQK